MPIREAHPADSAAIARVQVTSYQTAYAGIMPDWWIAGITLAEQTADWQTLLADMPTHQCVLVAEVPDSGVVGYALAQRRTPEPPLSFDGELVALHVLPPFQRRGYGRALFASAAARLRDQGCLTLGVGTLAANPIRAWYERLGGSFLVELPIELETTSVPEVFYRWNSIEQLIQALVTDAPTPAREHL